VFSFLPAVTVLPIMSSLIRKKKLSQFTVPSVTQVIYCKTLNQCISACSLFRLVNEEDYSIWSFDCEWYVDYIPGKTNPIALIQYSRQNIVVLFHISVYGLPPELVEILLNPRIIKVGVNINGDLQKLMRDFPPHFQNRIPSGCDLRRLSEVSGIPPSRSLAGMVENELELELPKPEETRCSNWETFPLTKEQLYYATQDVMAGYLLFQKIILRWKQNRGISESTEPIPFQLSPTQSNLPLAIDGKISDPVYLMITKNSIFFPQSEIGDSDEIGGATSASSTSSLSQAHLLDPLNTATLKRLKPSESSPPPFESFAIPLPPLLLQFLNSSLFTDFHTSPSSPPSSDSTPRFLSSKLQCYALWMSGHTITQIMKTKSIKLSTVYSYLLDCIDIDLPDPLSSSLSPSPQPLSNPKMSNSKLPPSRVPSKSRNGMEYSITQFEISCEMMTSLLSMYLTLVRSLQETTRETKEEPTGEKRVESSESERQKENQINESSLSSLSSSPSSAVSLHLLNGVKAGRIVPFKEIKDLCTSHGVCPPPDWMIRLVSIHCRRKVGNDWIEKFFDEEWLTQQIEARPLSLSPSPPNSKGVLS
jgi:hypothetical protein